MKQHGHSDKIALIGISPLFRKAVELARKVAATDASVFISGESGTGKEVIAQFIHQNSRRAGRPLVPINCAALPEPLLESEMFGHRKGAFTGADRDKPGLLETANGGTLFLDELTEMSHAAPGQAAARHSGRRGAAGRQRAAGRGGGRALHLGHQPRAAGGGGRRASSAATSSTGCGWCRSSCRRSASGRRTSRSWPTTSSPTTGSVTARWATGRPRLSEASIGFLRSRPWRGNVRELQNVIEHVAVLAEPDQVIQPNDIPVYDDAAEWPAESAVPAGVMDEAYHPAKDRVVAQFEKEYLTRLVSRAGGNMSKAARLASIDRTTLYRLMDKHEFHRDETSGSTE